MPTWTKEQQSAIDKRGCDLLVSAAAGSGKTAVLSERVLKRVTDGENPVPVEKLLIVTFTNAAAAEMRQRITAKLRDKLAANPDSEITARQLMMVPKASIMTIHSFCLNIIKSNFHLIDMDPSVGILDSAEGELMKIKIAGEVINEMYEKYGEDFSNMARWLADGRDDGLANEIINRHKYIGSFERPLDWLEEQTEKYNVDKIRAESGLSDEEIVEGLDWTRLIKTKYKSMLSAIKEEHEKIEDLIDEGGVTGYEAAIKDDKEKIETMLAVLNGSLDDIYKSARLCAWGGIGKKNKDCDSELASLAQSARTELKKKYDSIIGDIDSYEPKSILKGLNKVYPFMRLFFLCVKSFDEKFAEAKREKNVVDFADFEHIALKLLQDENLPVAEELREKYDEIYVDEYQDCNSVQEAIFSAIAKRIDGKSNNMFMVGDVKQSIYKFRQAEPTIFIGKMHTYSSSGVQQKIMLNKNFRSRKEVVNCVNNLFEKIMSEHLGDINYTDEEALCAGFDYPETDVGEYGGSPEILAVTTEDADDDILETRVGLEARLVACKIREMVGKFMVFDEKSGKYRKSCYKDFAVLLRSPRSRTEDIEAEFKALDIPYFSDVGGGLFEAHETELLISMLKITDNPLQDIPLIGFMRSLPGGFDENELLEIRNCAKKTYFYNAVKACAEGEGKLAEKCRKLIELIKSWRETSRAMPITGLISVIMEDTAFEAYISALPGGKNRLANIALFTELGRRFENMELKGLFSFVKYIEEQQGKTKGSETAKILSDSCDVVRIMSIHKSKGLEFPIVFIVGVGGNFNISDWTKGELFFDKQYGIGCSCFDPEKKIKYPLISRGAITYKIKLDTLSEEMRVLYVAMTRAREKLFVTVKGENKIEKIENALNGDLSSPLIPENARSYLDWLCMSVADKNSGWKLTVMSPEELTAKMAELTYVGEKAYSNNVSKETEAEIERRLSFEYQHLSSSKLASKYSVTEIKHRFDEENGESFNVIKRRSEKLPQFMREEKLSASEIGTLYHLILRFIDFSADDKEGALKSCKEKLVKEAFVSEKELENVNDKIILDFLSSDICEKMREAKENGLPVYREIPFNISVSGDVPTGDESLKDESVLLQGIIDCLFVSDDKCYVVDYKTESPSMSESELENVYRRQLELYRTAAEKITGKSVGGTFLYFLRRGKLHEVI